MKSVIFIVVGYAAFVFAMSFVARSYRMRIAALRGEILSTSRLNDLEAAMLDRVLPRSYSWRSAILVAFSYAQGLFMSSGDLMRECARFDHQCPTLTNDPRFWAMTELENACSYAVNPVFGLLAMAVRLPFMAKVRITFGPKIDAKAFDLRALSAA